MIIHTFRGIAYVITEFITERERAINQFHWVLLFLSFFSPTQSFFPSKWMCAFHLRFIMIMLFSCTTKWRSLFLEHLPYECVSLTRFYGTVPTSNQTESKGWVDHLSLSLSLSRVFHDETILFTASHVCSFRFD